MQKLTITNDGYVVGGNLPKMPLKVFLEDLDNNIDFYKVSYSYSKNKLSMLIEGQEYEVALNNPNLIQRREDYSKEISIINGKNLTRKEKKEYLCDFSFRLERNVDTKWSLPVGQARKIYINHLRKEKIKKLSELVGSKLLFVSEILLCSSVLTWFPFLGFFPYPRVVFALSFASTVAGGLTLFFDYNKRERIRWARNHYEEEKPKLSKFKKIEENSLLLNNIKSKSIEPKALPLEESKITEIVTSEDEKDLSMLKDPILEELNKLIEKCNNSPIENKEKYLEEIKNIILEYKKSLTKVPTEEIKLTVNDLNSKQNFITQIVDIEYRINAEEKQTVKNISSLEKADLLIDKIDGVSHKTKTRASTKN